eukprot:TCONS_00046390-protein
MLNMRVINLGTIGVIILCALINISGLVGTSWMVNGQIHEGLWKHYDDGENSTQDIDGRDALKATKTLLIMACFTLAISCAYWSLISLAKDMNAKILAAMLLATSLMQVIALSVYANSQFLGQRLEYHFGWSYIIVWCSTVLIFVPAGLCLIKRSYAPFS